MATAACGGHRACCRRQRPVLLRCAAPRRAASAPETRLPRPKASTHIASITHTKRACEWSSRGNVKVMAGHHINPPWTKPERAVALAWPHSKHLDSHGSDLDARRADADTWCAAMCEPSDWDRMAARKISQRRLLMYARSCATYVQSACDSGAQALHTRSLVKCQRTQSRRSWTVQPINGPRFGV